MTEQVSMFIMFMCGAIFYGLFYYFLFATIKSWKRALFKKRVSDNVRKTRARYVERRNKMRENGEQHSWITIQSGVDEEGNPKEFLVCEKTGWCPSTKDYFLDDYIKQEKKRIALAEEYKMYRDLEVGVLAARYKVSRDTMERIVEDVFNIKKSFHLKHIEKQLKDMKKG